MSRLSFTAKSTAISSAFDLISKLPGSAGTLIPATLEAGMEGVTLTKKTSLGWASIEIEDCIVDEEGIIAIFPENAAALIHSVSKGRPTIEVSHESGKTSFIGNGVATIKALADGSTDVPKPAAEFMPLSLSCGELHDAISSVSPACMNLERDNLAGLILTGNFDGLSIIGADGKRFIRVSITKKGLFPSILLPAKSIQFVLQAIAKKEKAKAKLLLSHKLLGIDAPGISIRLALSETPPMGFPDAQKARFTDPTEKTNFVEVDRHLLTDAITRITALSDPDTKRIIIRRKEGELILSTENSSSNAEVPIPCKGEGLTEDIAASGVVAKDVVSCFLSGKGPINFTHVPENGFVRIEDGNKFGLIFLQRIK